VAALIYASSSYAYLADAVAAAGGFERGEVERRVFPDGERYQRLTTPPAGRDVVLIGGTISDVETLEIYDLACALAKYDARSLTLVIPYFGYSTMERAVKPGEVVTAKTRARLFSALPTAGRVILVDLHADGIPHYFEGAMRAVHLYAKPVTLAAIRELGGPGPYVVGSTDTGRAKWVESLANELGVPAGFILKRRLDGAHTEVVALTADVRGKVVVLYDDMIRTGSSLVHAAEAYRAAGATAVGVVATHGVFPDGAAARLAAAGFSGVTVTDSHPRALAAGPPVRVVSLAPMLASHLQRGT
jgi:ribose-phosphate pyrophosphokinase